MNGIQNTEYVLSKLINLSDANLTVITTLLVPNSIILQRYKNELCKLRIKSLREQEERMHFWVVLSRWRPFFSPIQNRNCQHETRYYYEMQDQQTSIFFSPRIQLHNLIFSPIWATFDLSLKTKQTPLIIIQSHG